MSAENVSVEVRLFKTVPLLKYFEAKFIAYNRHIFDVLSSIDSFCTIKFFSVVLEADEDEQIDVVNAEELYCRALMYKINLFKTECYICTPLVETGEHL